MRYIKFTYITTILLVSAGFISAESDFLDKGGVSKLDRARLSLDKDSITDKTGSTIPYVERVTTGRNWGFIREKNALQVKVKNETETLSYDFYAPPQPGIPERLGARPGDPRIAEVPAKGAQWIPHSVSEFAMIEIKADVFNSDKHKTTTQIRLRNNNNNNTSEEYRLYNPFVLKTGDNKVFRIDLDHMRREGLFEQSDGFRSSSITGIDFLFSGAKDEDGNFFTKTKNKIVDTFAIKSIKVFSSDELHKGNHGNIVAESDETSPVPEPFSMITMGSGLLGFLRRRKLK